MSEQRFSDELEIARSTAVEAGRLLQEMLGDVRRIEYKGVANLVTDADHESEELIHTRLQEAFPADQFLGEESPGNEASAKRGRSWIVDPLDGTTNYAHGFPIFAVSIALVIDGIPEVGVVYAPVFGDLFAAIRGQGATRNDVPVAVSTVTRLEDAMLGSGFAYHPDRRLDNLDLWSRFVERSQACRRNGAAALDLSWVACGWLDGFWERELSPWDVAAGSLIVTEAGGTVSQYSGERYDPFCREIVAANPALHHVMVEEINVTRAGQRHKI